MITDPEFGETEQRRDWFAVERRVFEDPMFAKERFSRRDAWLWLIANAAKKDHHARLPCGVVALKRGDVIVARKHLAEVWRWSESEVRTFISQLVEANRLNLRQSNGHHPNVAALKNYGLYQPSAAGPSPVKSPVGRQSVASGSPHPYKDKDKDKKVEGEPPSSPKLRQIGGLSVGDRAEAEAAIQDYNRAAAEIGFARCGVTDTRCTAVAKRLRDIGQGDIAAGRERFREALQAIPHWKFLAGREKPRDGRTPFRLDLERLLSTGSGMGDVIAKLIDLHSEHGPAQTVAARPSRKAEFDAAWDEAQADELAAQRARRGWPPEPVPGGSDAFN